MKKLLLAACVVTLVSSASFARDGGRKTHSSSGEGKIGLGYNSQLTNPQAGLTSLSLRYWTSDSLGFEGIFGFALGDKPNVFDIGAKILGALKKEPNMTVYAFGLFGIESYTTENSDNDYTNFGLGGGFGVEFFLPGLSNLGIGTEVGLRYNNKPASQFGTFGDYFNTVGIHYYFQ